MTREQKQILRDIYVDTLEYYKGEDGKFDMSKLSVYDNGAGGETCAYRGTDGAMCAVGRYIPDALYHEDIEENSADHLYEEGFYSPYLPEKYHFKGCYNLFNILQKYFHDTYRYDALAYNINGKLLPEKIKKFNEQFEMDLDVELIY